MEAACTSGKVTDHKLETVEDGSNTLQLQIINTDLSEVRAEVSIQANDYEIERATGILPARKRFIPFKYRDFQSLHEDDKDDSDYDPESMVGNKEPKVKRRRGRPRKYPRVKTDPTSNEGHEDQKSDKSVMIRTSGGYKCLACNRLFSQKGNLKVHLLTHTDERPWPCDIENCDKAFRTKESLRRHKLSHMGIKPFGCSQCSKTFCSALSLQEHQSLHSDQRPYACPQCKRSFRQVSCLRRHLLTHSSDMPHTCKVCSRKFSQAIYLRSHMKVHTGEKPFSCDLCSKSFAHASDLSRHKIIHLDTKPYNCSYCSMRFNDPSSRRRHEREHQVAKRYLCHLCAECFKRASQLRTHLFRCHGGLKEGVEFRILEGPVPVCYRIEVHQAAEEDKSKAVGGKVLDLSCLDQKKLLSLIENLNRNMVVQEVEVATGEAVVTGEKAAKEDNAVEGIISQSEGAVEVEEMILPAELATVMEARKEDGTAGVITIAQLPLRDESSELGPTYHILQDLGTKGGEEGMGEQVYEVHYQEFPDPADSAPADSAECTTNSISETVVLGETYVASPSASAVVSETSQEQKLLPTTVASSDLSVQAASSPLSAFLNTDYVTKPEFACQEYYDWLSAFTEVCKMMPVPLEVNVFQKISQVHKSLSDFMASPSGVITDKSNFKILMSISKDLNHILHEHLTCMLQNLSEGETPQT